MPQKLTHSIAALLAALSVGSAGAADPREKHAHDFAKDVDAFHAVLAPLWHARPGKERAQNVCVQAPRLEQLAAAIHSGNPRPLQASVAALRAQCQSAPADIDAVFSQVHDAFHRLVEPH
ncbi:MAG: hypothetical protein A2045_11215 [Rhodocyclales bacterium GWA2_65_20]|nr:MAG: hypothetical protein A2045_11215 [Rhodocyclales bacterium GWA2_65_20]